jgi:hypothetical protein
MEYWVRADDESNTHTTRRYTQTLVLKFENLTTSAVKIHLCLDGIQWMTEQLPAGAVKKVTELNDIKPQTVAYNFKILAP